MALVAGVALLAGCADAPSSGLQEATATSMASAGTTAAPATTTTSVAITTTTLSPVGQILADNWPELDPTDPENIALVDTLGEAVCLAAANIRDLDQLAVLVGLEDGDRTIAESARITEHVIDVYCPAFAQ